MMCDTTVLAIGMRIRHVRHPELIGEITDYEWQKSGVLSALPYKVRWDDDDRAYRLLGLWQIWPAASMVEPLRDAAALIEGGQ